MKILFVGTLTPAPGGTSVLNVSLLRGCRAMGHEVEALAPGLAGATGGTIPGIAVERYEVPGWQAWPDDFSDRAYRKIESAALKRRFAALVRHRRPDLVLAGHERFACDVPELARQAGLPCALLFHSGATEALLASQAGDRVLDGLRGADLVITVARHLARMLRRRGVGRVRAIPNFVDLDRFRPRPGSRRLARGVGIAEGDTVVMHVSNLKSNKRPLDLVHSARDALRQDPRLRYVVVGDGAMRGAMESLCRKLGLSERFRFAGWVDHRRLPDYFSVADLVVMPSDVEGLALVYLEAQASGCVLVASDIPAAREVVRHGETGLLFRKADVADLAAKTVHAASDPALRRAIGRRARAGAHLFARDKALAAYARTFAGLVN